MSLTGASSPAVYSSGGRPTRSSFGGGSSAGSNPYNTGTQLGPYRPSDPRAQNMQTGYTPNPYQAQYDQAFDFFDGAAAPGMSLIDQQNADLWARANRTQGDYGQQRDLAQQGYDIDLGLLGGQEARNNIDRDAARRQPGVLSQLFDITRGKYEANRGYLGQQDEFTTRQRDMTNKYAQEGYALSERGASQQFQQQSRAATSSATARGAVGSSGYSDTRGDIKDTYSLATDTARSAAQQKVDQGQLGAERDWAQTGNQRTNLDLGMQSDTVNNRESQAQAQDRIKTLDSMASDFGLKRDQLRNALDRTLQSMGMSQQTSVDNILDAISSGNRDKAAMAENVIRQAASFAGNSSF